MENITEEWKPIIGYEQWYEISNLGRIRTTGITPSGRRKKSQILKPYPSNNHYLRIALRDNNGKSTNYSIHRLVALAFIPNPNNYPQINHIDSNRQNNIVTNLEWCTASQNSIHAFTNGFRIAHWAGILGIDNPLTKPIICCETGKVYYGVRELINDGYTGVNHIRDCCKNRRETVNKQHWKYYEPNEIVSKARNKGFMLYPNSFTGDEYYIYLSLVQKWLREEKKLIIYVKPYDCESDGVLYESNIYARWIAKGLYNTYEEALSAGINKALELI